MGRTDDIINAAGHRLSTGALEEVVGCHPAVAECAVVGIAAALKGEVRWGLVVLKNGSNRKAAEVATEVAAQVRDTEDPAVLEGIARSTTAIREAERGF